MSSTEDPTPSNPVKVAQDLEAQEDLRALRALRRRHLDVMIPWLVVIVFFAGWAAIMEWWQVGAIIAALLWVVLVVILMRGTKQ